MQSYEADGIFKALAWIAASYVICSEEETVAKGGHRRGGHSDELDDTWQPVRKAFLGLLLSAHRNHERITAVEQRGNSSYGISVLTPSAGSWERSFHLKAETLKEAFIHTSTQLHHEHCLFVRLLICLDWNNSPSCRICLRFCTDISGQSTWSPPAFVTRWSPLMSLTSVVKVLVKICVVSL